MTELILEIGRKVREARKAQRLTHEALACACGVSHSRIEALENGRVADMCLGNVQAILLALGLTLLVGPLGAEGQMTDGEVA